MTGRIFQNVFSMVYWRESGAANGRIIFQKINKDNCLTQEYKSVGSYLISFYEYVPEMECPLITGKLQRRGGLD